MLIAPGLPHTQPLTGLLGARNDCKNLFVNEYSLSALLCACAGKTKDSAGKMKERTEKMSGRE